MWHALWVGGAGGKGERTISIFPLMDFMKVLQTIILTSVMVISAVNKHTGQCKSSICLLGILV